MNNEKMRAAICGSHKLYSDPSRRDTFIPIISGTLPRSSNVQLRRDLYDQIYKHPAHRAEEEQQRDDRQVLAAVLIRAQQHQQANTGV